MSVIQLTEKSELSQDGRIYEAFNFFHEKLKEPIKTLQDSELAINFAKLTSVILERLFFVNITSGELDNPYLIFESLNSKGQELTQADLVRNYIFTQLRPNEREEIYRSTWFPLQEKFMSNLKQEEASKQLTTALWFYLECCNK
jgi:uncharacterized protein with ParB-like and HNH nuclease domain